MEHVYQRSSGGKVTLEGSGLHGFTGSNHLGGCQSVGGSEGAEEMDKDY